MNKGFTIVEVSILFVIFLIVAFLVAPLSLDDTLQAKNISRWKSVQQDFTNILYSINNMIESDEKSFNESVLSVFTQETKNTSKNYKITYLNGALPDNKYNFNNLEETFSNATVGIKFSQNLADSTKALILYDVNGSKGPNIWGKDVFGYNLYDDKIEPFCKRESLSTQKKDCSKNGTGLCCSNYYLIGGSFD